MTKHWNGLENGLVHGMTNCIEKISLTGVV